jgi:urease accessory protein
MMGRFDVLGNVVLLTSRANAERIGAQVSTVVNREERWAAGASKRFNDAWLSYKVMGMETRIVREKILAFWALVRSQVVQAPLPAEFAWR